MKPGICNRGRFSSADTTSKANAPKRNALNTMSKMAKLDSTNDNGIIASISAARSPVTGPKSRLPNQYVIPRSARAAKAVGMRAPSSFSPKMANDPAWIQWKSAGLSMIGTPSIRGTR